MDLPKLKTKKGFLNNSVFTHLFKIFYLIGELAVVNLAIILSFFLVAINKSFEFELSFRDYESTIPLLMFLAFIYIDYLGMTQFYRKTYTDMFSASVIFSFLSILSVSTIAFFFRWFLISRYVLVLAAILMVILSFIWSAACLKISKLIYSRGKLLIIATSVKEADTLYGKVQQELNSLHLDYIGYTTDTDLDRLYRRIDLGTEVMLSPSVSENIKSSLMLYCADHDKTIYVVPQFSDLVFSKFRVLQFYDMPTFMIDSLGLTFQQRLFKRSFDIVFSALVLLVTLPLFLVIVILIKLDSSGPAIFTQERITLDGRSYRIYKFRTMMANSEARFGTHLAVVNDPRVTRAGKFLRFTRLDELPQFFNILKGDMSVVGPRPEQACLMPDIENRVPGFTQRLKVKSGLTGLAQIYGKYDTKNEDKLRFDMMYIRNYSFLLDMRIILLTIRGMLPSNIYARKTKISNFEATEPPADSARQSR